MNVYQFSLIVSAPEMEHESILNLLDQFAEAGCTDASIRGHANGVELLFDRTAESLQKAITSAIAMVEGVGKNVLRVEIERELIAA
ncbi:MAG: hypothetical protein AB7H80_02160 [Candidatus Kapaibacterium sp.]